MGRIISLEGFMGCGKSSSGKVLAALLQIPFIDLDHYIEERARESISGIFDTKGQDYFRDLEHDCLLEVLDSNVDSFVLSLGGGTPCRKDNAAAIKEKTFCIYLRASEEELVRNLEGTDRKRPMLRTSSVEGLLKQREPVYSDLADLVVDVDGMDEMQVALQIIANLAD